MSDRLFGNIETHTQFSVVCGICEVETECHFGGMPWEGSIITSQKGFARLLRTLGWKLTKNKGWVCPKCLVGSDERREDTVALV